MNEEWILDKGVQLAFALDICVGQMKASQSTFDPEKRAHLAILEEAKGAITYKINTCTVEEISNQVTAAYSCGFKSSHHFSRFIKQQYGESPTKIRTNQWVR